MIYIQICWVKPFIMIFGNVKMFENILAHSYKYSINNLKTRNYLPLKREVRNPVHD